MTIGVHPTTSALPHRAEYIMRSRLTYRELKSFHGTITHKGKTSKHQEILFVRKKGIETSWRFMLDRFGYWGQRGIDNHLGLKVTLMGAREQIEASLEMLHEDPLAFIRQPVS
jgi:hypothetical protein